MHPFHPARARGFSLVELMVAMLIGLIGMIIIFQVFEVSEGIKRTTTSGGDAQQNGAVALYVMEHDLRNAGMGFNDVPNAGCTILGYDSARATPDFTLMLVPALICAPGSTAPGGNCPGTGTAGTSPDQLTVVYGSQPLISDASPLGVNMAASDVQVQVNNTFAYRPGDLLVLMQPASGNNCSLIETTAIASTTVTRAAAGVSYLLNTGSQVLARLNKAGGMGVAYGGVGSTNVSRAYNLGNLYDPASGAATPVYNTYAIDSSNALTVSSAFVIDPATRAPQVSAVADNIVHMRALYGLDDGVNDGSVTFAGTFVAGDGLVDRFVSAATFNAAGTPWQSIIAVRVAMVARSALAEKPSAGLGAPCDTTPNPPTWSGGAFDLSANPDWQCYRYRVFETTIPLRNWIWKSS
jgi:type IV pilus assembly protein PilW